MSVVVLGMEMPKGCDSCFVPARHCNLWLRVDGGSRHEDCPLLPLPEKHGRMIDCDEFAAQMRGRQEAAYAWMENAQDDEARHRAEAVISFISEVTLTLAKMETVIEAEGEKE